MDFNCFHWDRPLSNRESKRATVIIRWMSLNAQVFCIHKAKLIWHLCAAQAQVNQFVSVEWMAFAIPVKISQLSMPQSPLDESIASIIQSSHMIGTIHQFSSIKSCICEWPLEASVNYRVFVRFSFCLFASLVVRQNGSNATANWPV